MKRNLFAVSVLSFALAGLGSAQGSVSAAQNGTQYTQVQLKQLAHDAHTPEQYSALAGFYGQQQKSLLLQAAEEKQEWVRRSQNIVSVAAKYPRPVDSARYLYEYYSSKANEAGQLEAKYSALASTQPGVPTR